VSGIDGIDRASGFIAIHNDDFDRPRKTQPAQMRDKRIDEIRLAKHRNDHGNENRQFFEPFLRPGLSYETLLYQEQT
jgi:hypothetical protein